MEPEDSTLGDNSLSPVTLTQELSWIRIPEMTWSNAGCLAGLSSDTELWNVQSLDMYQSTVVSTLIIHLYTYVPESVVFFSIQACFTNRNQALVQ